ncbi:hypothetical protein BSZ32_13590 [Rubritalea profundi]|uniref:Uncharacterized protein n=1 Tax=Rubritalea profundi TaxID=1658618 RepID=A0A2S7U353_9BACT|nr:hypothetical protein BSZ32_13590 [Rubritalea profundi]
MIVISALVSAGDPPVYMIFNNAPAIGEEQKDPTHTANFGVKLQEHCKKIGLECAVVYPGAPDVKYKSPTDYLIAKLKTPTKSQ